MTVIELCLFGIIINIGLSMSNKIDDAYQKGVSDGLHIGFVDGRTLYDEEIFERGRQAAFDEVGRTVPRKPS